MWRALSYAIGSMMILLGVQSLAFEQVQLAPGKDALQIVKRLLRDEGSGSGAVNSGGVNSGGVNSVTRPNDGQRVFQSANASTFAPSRFPNGGFGGTTFSAAPYRDLTQSGGLGIRSGQSTNVPRVDLASFQTGQSETQLSAGSTTLVEKPGRVIRSKDWMPWSLLAIGSLIVLYTRSFGARSI
ncbi:hypothetical protein N9L06_01050 [Mariniblastus sp.]|nr:hypothetical protein [Mariniblastus sp.]